MSKFKTDRKDKTKIIVGVLMLASVFLVPSLIASLSDYTIIRPGEILTGAFLVDGNLNVDGNTTLGDGDDFVNIQGETFVDGNLTISGTCTGCGEGDCLWTDAGDYIYNPGNTVKVHDNGDLTVSDEIFVDTIRISDVYGSHIRNKIFGEGMNVYGGDDVDLYLTSDRDVYINPDGMVSIGNPYLDNKLDVDGNIDLNDHNLVDADRIYGGSIYSHPGILDRKMISLGENGNYLELIDDVKITSISEDGEGKVVCIKSDGTLGTCEDRPDLEGKCTCG